MPDNQNKTVVNIDQIIADFGDYYIDQGQNMDNIHNMPMEEFETMSAFNVTPTNNTLVRESLTEYDDVLQQFQEEFTPLGGVTFKPREIRLYQVKIDQRISPGKLQQSWLAFLGTNKATVEEWPLIRYLVQEYLIGKMKENLEMAAIYNGVFEEPEEGQPGAPAKVMDGINKQFQDFIDAGDLGPVFTGAIPTDPVDFVTYCESLIKGIPEKYRYKPQEMNMNRTLRDRYKEGVNKKYNGYYQQQQNKFSMLNFENITVTGRPSMMGKNRIWISPKVNNPMFVKGFENSQVFDMQKDTRHLKMWTDWWMGIGFITPELIFMNDQN